VIRCHLGIRFAAPPVGARRWRPPEDVRDAQPLGTWALDCPQPPTPFGAGTRSPGQSEDCLFLNIWAPGDAEGLPVLVWFYGGSFLFGSASSPMTDGSILASRGAVVVSAAYRVGLLGYLAHPALTAESPYGSSGNYGLLDVLSALSWVRERIADYGGDPRRITAFGVSAGSASLALLQTSPRAAGAFDRLILQSPGAFRPLATLEAAEAAAEVAYGPSLEVLRAWDEGEVLRQAAALVPAMRSLTASRLVRPIRDGWVVPADDRDSYRTGAFFPVPTIVGGNRDEGSALTASWTVDSVDAYQKLLSENFGGFAEEAAARYPVHDDDDVRTAVAALFSDTQFSFGARGIAAAVSSRQPRTWRYLYTWLPPGRTDGPHHGEEVAGVFACSTVPGAVMADAWVRFAATGDPNGDGLAWPPYTRDGDEILELGDPPHVISGWRRQQLDFLERYYDGNHG
jgi:para-nitrobenzyl esterase